MASSPSSNRPPPRFVPTLTEVVQQSAAPTAVPERSLPEALEVLQEQILHRVLQRIDLSLERKLNEAVAQLILDHTRDFVPRLREEVEFVVRQAVTEAVAEELAMRGPPL